MTGVLLAATFTLAATSTESTAGRSLRTESVILITLDGVRIQEMFAGMDPVIANDEEHSGIYDLERARARYWRPSPEERRKALMPFFWSSLAPRGIVLGNKDRGSRALVKNPLLFSAPGYVEMLTGQVRPDVRSNDLIRYPYRTVLEYVQRELDLDFLRVAMVGSWEGFSYLASSKADVFFTNGGYEKVPAHLATPRMEYLGDLQFQIMALWEVGRSDAVTFGLALEYLKSRRPRLLYIALGESDDWPHAKRYDRLLDYLNVADCYLRELWDALESSEFYRGKTTLILTTDHGRGIRPTDWDEHGEGIEGSEDIWIAVIGPDTPDRGELAPYRTVRLSDVAATLARFFSLDDREFNPDAGLPIEAAFAALNSPVSDSSKD